MGGEQKPDTRSSGETTPDTTGNLSQMQDVPVTVTMVLGHASKTLDELLEIGEQSVIELEKAVGDPVEISVNGKLFARGEVVTISENFGVRLTEIVGREQEHK